MRKAREAKEHYGLEENDIFITPDEIFEVIGKHLGISVEQHRVIMLMNSSNYFKRGKIKTAEWQRWHEEINIKTIQWCDEMLGTIHFPKWGPNEITGEKSGGPPMGVLLWDMTPRS